MKFFNSMIKTNVNNVKLYISDKLSINGSQNNNYQDYEEIDYNQSITDETTPQTTTPANDETTPQTTTTANDDTTTTTLPNTLMPKDTSLDLCLINLFGYIPTGPKDETTTTVSGSKDNNYTDIKKETRENKKKLGYMYKVESSYSKFLSFLTSNIKSMGKLGSYVPQGVCNVGEFTLVSCYDGDKEEKPRVLIIDSYGSRRWIDLDLPTNTHVGGITYDPINNNIWITGSDGEVGIYSYDSIINNNGKPATAISNIQGNVMNANGNKVASYTTYYDGKIYVGSFNENDKGDVKEYTIGQDGRSVVLTNEFTVPNKAQGISFTKQNGKTYMAVSCSYGRFNDSSLELYEYSGGNINKIDDIKMPPMLEQVTFNEDGTLKCVFESNAKKYDDASIRIPSVCSLDISSCLK